MYVRADISPYVRADISPYVRVDISLYVRANISRMSGLISHCMSGRIFHRVSGLISHLVSGRISHEHLLINPWILNCHGMVSNYCQSKVKCYYEQWCSGNFSLVGTLTWHYGHIHYHYWGGGGGCLNKWSFFKGKNLCPNRGV